MTTSTTKWKNHNYRVQLNDLWNTDEFSLHNFENKLRKETQETNKVNNVQYKVPDTKPEAPKNTERDTVQNNIIRALSTTLNKSHREVPVLKQHTAAMPQPNNPTPKQDSNNTTPPSKPEENPHLHPTTPKAGTKGGNNKYRKGRHKSPKQPNHKTRNKRRGKNGTPAKNRNQVPPFAMLTRSNKNTGRNPTSTNEGRTGAPENTQEVKPAEKAHFPKSDKRKCQANTAMKFPSQSLLAVPRGHNIDHNATEQNNDIVQHPTLGPPINTMFPAGHRSSHDEHDEETQSNDDTTISSGSLPLLLSQLEINDQEETLLEEKMPTIQNGDFLLSIPPDLLENNLRMAESAYEDHDGKSGKAGKFNNISLNDNSIQMLIPDMEATERFQSTEEWEFKTKSTLTEIPVAFFQSTTFEYVTGIIVPTYAAEPLPATLKTHANMGVFGVELTELKSAETFIEKLKEKNYVNDTDQLWTHVAEFLLPTNDPDVWDGSSVWSDTYWWGRKAEADDAIFLHKNTCNTKLLIIRPNDVSAKKKRKPFTLPQKRGHTKKASDIYRRATRTVLRDITGTTANGEVTWRRNLPNHQKAAAVQKSRTDPNDINNEPLGNPNFNAPSTKPADDTFATKTLTTSPKTRKIANLKTNEAATDNIKNANKHKNPIQNQQPPTALTRACKQEHWHINSNDEYKKNTTPKTTTQIVNPNGQVTPSEVNQLTEERDFRIAEAIINLDVNRFDQQIQKDDIEKARAIRIWGEAKSIEENALRPLLSIHIHADNAARIINKHYPNHADLYTPERPCQKQVPKNLRIKSRTWTKTREEFKLTEADLTLAKNLREKKALSLEHIKLAHKIRKWAKAHDKSAVAEGMLTNTGTTTEEATRLLRLVPNENPNTGPAWVDSAYFLSDSEDEREDDINENSRNTMGTPRQHNTQELRNSDHPEQQDLPTVSNNGKEVIIHKEGTIALSLVLSETTIQQINRERHILDLKNTTPEPRSEWPKPIIKAWILADKYWVPLYFMLDTAATSTIDLRNIRKSAEHNVAYGRLLSWIHQQAIHFRNRQIDAKTPFNVKKMIAFQTRIKGHESDSESDIGDELKISFHIRDEITQGCPVHGFIGIETIGKHNITIQPRQKHTTTTGQTSADYNISVRPFPTREYIIGSVTPSEEEILCPMVKCYNINEPNPDKLNIEARTIPIPIRRPTVNP